MSAPVTERARAASRARGATIPAQRSPFAPRGSAQRGGAVEARPGRGASEPAAGGKSARRTASARREDRLRRIVGGRPARTAATSGRPQFVLLIMVLLAVGLVATLWLSTAAAADSYRLKDATAEARALSEQAERLHREVAVLASAPELARRAAELGMTPVQDPARLVVAPDGGVSVVGEPRAAVAPPPPAAPAPPGGPQPGAPAEDTAPEGTPPDGAAPGDAAPDDAAPEDAAPEDAPEDAAPDGTEPDGTGSARLAAPGAEAGSPPVDGGGADTGAPGTGDGTTAPDEHEQGDTGGADAPGTGGQAAAADGGGTDAG